MTRDSAGFIVDVGMHDGSDTAYYLAKGFDVLAVEANPRLVAAAEARFAREIADGRLTIAHLAVADGEGAIDFHISRNDLWSSIHPELTDRGIEGPAADTVTIPCTTLATLLDGVPRPRYVKVDVEGADGDCIRSLRSGATLPDFVSFEADIDKLDSVAALVEHLSGIGYARFQMVNQAMHPHRRLSRPPLEGRFVDMRFTKEHSGPFGLELPADAWCSKDELVERLRTALRHQAALVSYNASGRVAGIPVGWLHRPLRAVYTAPLVERGRVAWANWRGVEPAGWFDIHATLTGPDGPERSAG